MPALAITGAARASRADVLYDSIDGTAATAAGEFPNAAQQITFNGGSQSYAITSVSQLFVGWSDLTQGNQTLVVSFYNGASLSKLSTNDFSSATFLGQRVFTITPPSAAGLYDYDLTSAFGTSIVTPTNTVDVTVGLYNTSGSAFSTAAGSPIIDGSPSTGTNPGSSWLDVNADGVFAGSELYSSAQFSSGTVISPVNLGLEIDGNAVTSVNRQWNNSAGGTWETATNWNPNGVPTQYDTATFNLNSSTGYTVTIGSSADTARNFVVSTDRVTLGIDPVNAGSFNVSNAINVGVPASSDRDRRRRRIADADPGRVRQPQQRVGGRRQRGAFVSGSTTTASGIGTLSVGANINLISTGGVFVYPGSLLILQRGAELTTFGIALAGVTDAWTGKVDVTNNGLDLPGNILATVTNQVKEGYNAGRGRQLERARRLRQFHRGRQQRAPHRDRCDPEQPERHRHLLSRPTNSTRSTPPLPATSCCATRGSATPISTAKSTGRTTR